MFRLSFQKIHRVLQNRLDNFETFLHGFRRAGEIYYQSRTANAADATTEGDDAYRLLIA